MKLYEEAYSEQKKKSKIPVIIGISIAFLVIITVTIIYLIVYLQSTVLRINLDGANASKLEELLIIEENEGNTDIYVPIRRIAQYFGYQDYSGDYKYRSEDKTKCYVTNQSETAMFTLDSSTLVKTRGDSDYEYVELDRKVFEKNGELYTTKEGIEKAYNVAIFYDKDKNNIDIFTMGYLVSTYANKLKLEEYEAEFSEQKTIFENMLIVEQDEIYGVIDATSGNYVLEPKYDEISYFSSTSDFLIKSNGKYGVIDKNANIKVRVAYDEIKMIDSQNQLYLVKLNDLYGIVDSKGTVIIAPEYKQIGLNTDVFLQNGIENQYVIMNQLIPIKDDKMWGFFDIKGKQITDFVYTGVGCTTSKVSSSYPLLAIPSYNIVVVEKNKMFNLMRINGEDIINGYVLDSAYVRTDTENGENTYFMTYNGKTTNIEEWLVQIGE